MKKPQLSIRMFLVLCLVLGSVAIPVGWRQYQKRKTAEAEKAEAERLKKELAGEYSRMPPHMVGYTLSGTQRQTSPVYTKWLSRVEKLEMRIEILTGTRPQRPARTTIYVY